MRGINDTTKMVDVIRKGKFELLAFTEMKLKGNGEVSWFGVNGIIAGIQEVERARGGVAILLNDVWHSAVVDFGCVSSYGLNSSFQWLKFVWWWDTAKIKEVVKKLTDSRMTWT